MPTRTPHPRRPALIALVITAVVVISAAAISARSPEVATPARSPLVTANSNPTARFLLPPINRAVPQPLPATTDPVALAQQVSRTLWGTQAPDVVGYQVTVAASPDLRDPEVDQLIDAIDAELAAGPARVGRIDMAAANGIDHATTVTVTALDPARSLTLRITCTPDCRLLGITR